MALNSGWVWEMQVTSYKLPILSMWLHLTKEALKGREDTTQGNALGKIVKDNFNQE